MNITQAFERQARSRQDQPAILMGQYKATHGELLAMACVIAARLQEAGVGRGDRVGLAVGNPVAGISLTLALAHIGAVSVGLPIPIRDDALEAISVNCGIRYLVHARKEPHAIRQVPAERQLVFANLSARPGPELRVPPPALTEPDEIWRISLSSGTTGMPKGIEWSHGASVLVTGLRRAIVATTPQDRVLIAMDAAMNYAVHNWLRVLDTGGCVVLPESRSAEDALRACAMHGATQLITTTGTALGMVRRLQDAAAEPIGPFPALRSMWVGGATVSPQLQAALRERLCPALYNNYGASEVGMAALADPALMAQHPSCAGRLLPWVEAQAIDADGKPLAPGKRGLLRFRTAAMATRYSGPEGGNAGGLRGGWFYSSDVGAISPDGILWLDGRGDDVLNLSGVKIDPARIEAVIEEDPAITESAVVVVPDALGAPILVAVIVAPAGADVQALKARCLAKLGVNCQPKGVVTVPSLPRNSAGKIEREVLRGKVRMGPKPEAPPVPDDALKFD